MKTVFAILIFTAAAIAQNVSPVVHECSRRCNSFFEVTNQQAEVLNVTIETFSFTLTPDGKAAFEPLTKDAVVTMPEMSARIPANATWQFDYNIKCNAPPCRIALMAAMSVGHPNAEGMLVRMFIPEILYVCEKQKGCRRTVRQQAGLSE